MLALCFDMCRMIIVATASLQILEHRVRMILQI